MRTKTLIATAALGVLSAASAVAQVYSVNAVGYINLTVPSGFSIIANQLNAGGNKVTDVFTSPVAMTLYKWNGTGYDINSYDADFQSWDHPDMTLKPGEGVWIKNPGTAAITITLVGEVPQGTLSTPLQAGFNIASSQVPQSGAVASVLKYTPSGADVFYFFRNGNYSIFSYDPDFQEWSPSEPSPAVGEAFWIKAAVATTWTRSFSVNQ